MAEGGWDEDGLFPDEPSMDHAFGGATYIPERDYTRLRCQIDRVYKVMSDRRWRTLDGISSLTHDPPASVSARLRDLRKEKWGGYTVERRYVRKGLFEYRLIA